MKPRKPKPGDVTMDSLGDLRIYDSETSYWMEWGDEWAYNNCSFVLCLDHDETIVFNINGIVPRNK